MVMKHTITYINEQAELVRTDSEILTSLYYRKDGNKMATKLSPLGRERRIKRLDEEFALEFNTY